jgi:hypothetical protein
LKQLHTFAVVAVSPRGVVDIDALGLWRALGCTFGALVTLACEQKFSMVVHTPITRQNFKNIVAAVTSTITDETVVD